VGEQDEDYEMGGMDGVDDSRIKVRSSPPVTSASPQSTAGATPADTTAANTPAVGTPVASTMKGKRGKTGKHAVPRKKAAAKTQKKKRKAPADCDDELDEIIAKKRQMGKKGKKRESEVPSGYNTETDDQMTAARGVSVRRETTPPQPPSPVIPPSPVDRFDDTGAELYCVCRKPDSGKWMIACDGACDDWYHGECVKVAEEDENLIDKYYCNDPTLPIKRNRN
jgi:COMPASS component SPP1